MSVKKFETIDGNEAVASVAYRLNEVIAIYPITPSSTMGEWADSWSSEGKPNIWGTIPTVVEMQSEAGAVGAVHGALQTGSLTTTFTASQGLLLMIPNMFKIAGELTPAVFHVAARSVATHALSIFCDHSDVMATRATGFALLSSSSVQEAMDFALIAQVASLKSRIPFLHFFDGFRTSHEISKIELLSDDILRAMIDEELILAHRSRALSPDHPVIRGTAQNPDVFFQAREGSNPYYINAPDIVQETMDKFAKLTGRAYRPFEYYGPPDAERVIVIMGSGAEVVHETVDYLNKRGEQVGVVKVHLYRPFDAKRFVESLPSTTKAIAVLDHTKEPGSSGEPLYQDCVASLYQGAINKWGNLIRFPTVTGGRYGLSSKEFTPAMVKGIFEQLSLEKPGEHFTVGIHDDITNSSIDYDPEFSTETDGVYRALFYGLGSDGTVGANKNSIKIIGKNTDYHIQGYFVYDSKKAGAVTISHLRFGPRPIRSAYLVDKANFVGCHQQIFLHRYDMLKHILPGGTFLLNTFHSPEEVWDHLPHSVQKQIIEKKLKFYVIDAYKVAKESGLGKLINTVMQACFFAISEILPRDKAIEAIRDSIYESYGDRGEEIVHMNLQAVDNTLAHLFEVKVPDHADSLLEVPPPVSNGAPQFVRGVLGKIIAGEGDELPVSALPADGTFPTGTAKWEKRNLALEIPVWEPNICIQCGKCVMVCPHAVIRIKAYDPNLLQNAPDTFKSSEARDEVWKGLKYTIQVAPEDCTGCGICVDICPAKSKSETKVKALNMKPQPPLRDKEMENWDFFLKIPETNRLNLHLTSIRQQQVEQPLFEFSGACSGCGETPYVKLLSQLFGDRLIVANATGCSSIYGGNLPTTPWTTNEEGRGPAWSNSLFENNAEFGLGFRISLDKQKEFASELLKKMSPVIGEDLVGEILTASQKSEADIYEQRKRVEVLKKRLQEIATEDAKRLLGVADTLVEKSVWLIGGDGWAYDIGFGGLDHVLASGRKVKVLVLDTEVYSNTGGQMSKATPRAAVAKFAAGGKPTSKKDLGLIAMTYGNIYVASVAMGAKDEHTLRAFLEAEAYDGPALIIAYSHCIAHGINMTTAMQNQKAAVDSGQWLLYRYNPERAKDGENPLHIDSRSPKIPVQQYLLMENRFKMLLKTKPEEAKRLFNEAQQDVNTRRSLYEYLAARGNKTEEQEKEKTSSS
ncbi:MAG TPA: pyruvate:ferredoxin (flavodoxin) oxidoreductase [Thermodesulfobacteriota bacterium]|nr:pyruvate:ferredoxin (flavodoxin) oxidoreductase [Thermodesulfobacteriota bacterium]